MKELSYKELVAKIGIKEADKEVARQLRLFANLIESNDYPNIFEASLLPEGCTSIDDPNDLIKLGNINVTLSYPWPG